MVLGLVLVIGLFDFGNQIDNGETYGVDVDCFDRNYNLINDVTCTEEVLVNDFYRSFSGSFLFVIIVGL